MKLEQRLLFYAMGGVFTEVVFTATKSLYYHQDLMLHGNTQLWVIALYTIGGLIFEWIHSKYSSKKLRIGLFVIVVYTLEYTAGITLRKVLGECPWNYTQAGNIHGLVQIYYLPAWVIFAIIADYGIKLALTHDLVEKN